MLRALAFFISLSAGGAPLRIGTSGDYPPFSTVSSDGTRTGFDIDVSQRLAQGLSRPLDFVAFRWPELSERSSAGTFDLVASGVTIRPQRALLGRFTRPYAVSEAVVLIRSEDAQRFHTLADLDQAAEKVSVNHGGYLESVARASFGKAAIEPVSDNLQLAAPVISGRAAALVTDSIEERTLLAAHPELMRLAALTRDRKALFIPGPLDSEAARTLHGETERWLIENNAGVDALRVQWLGADSSLSVDAVRAESIVALIDQRLGLMPWVGAYKRANKLPIEDREREQKVLAAVAERARADGYPEDRAVALFRVLIDAAKDVEHAAGPLEPTVDLATIRAVLTDLSNRIVDELAAARGIDVAARARLGAGINAMTWPGLTAERRREIAAAL